MVKSTTYEELLSEVFDLAQGWLREELAEKGRGDDYALFKRTFVFHMTDWIDDLRRLHALAEAPDLCPEEKAKSVVAGFLYHAIPHLRAAGRLLLDEIPDAFRDDEVMTKLDDILHEADAVDQPR